MLSDLQNYSVREVEHKDFSEGFWKGVENVSRNNSDNLANSGLECKFVSKEYVPSTDLSTSAASYMPDDMRRAAENVPVCTVY